MSADSVTRVEGTRYKQPAKKRRDGLVIRYAWSWLFNKRSGRRLVLPIGPCTSPRLATTLKRAAQASSLCF